MNPKDQLDKNELEEENHEQWHELHDKEIVGDLWALKTEVTIENIHEKEHLENELNAIKDEVMMNVKKNKAEYTPMDRSNGEDVTLELANAWRASAVQNVKDNIQKYPWRLWWLIKAIDNRW